MTLKFIYLSLTLKLLKILKVLNINFQIYATVFDQKFFRNKG